MASGDTLLQWAAVAGSPTATNFAGLTQRAGGSTPGELINLVAFDAASDEHWDIGGVIPQNYAGGGYTLRYGWIAASATSNNTRWGGAFRSIEDDAEDVDTSHTYDYNYTDDAAPSASGELTWTSITFTDGADADSCGAGDEFILRVQRQASHANDTMAGDAQLRRIELRET